MNESRCKIAGPQETCPDSELSKLVLAIRAIKTTDSVLPAGYKPSFPQRGDSLLDAVANICVHHSDCERAAVAIDKTDNQIKLYVATEPPPDDVLRNDITWLLLSANNKTAADSTVSPTFIENAYSFVYYELKAVEKSLPSYEDLILALESRHSHDVSERGSSDRSKTVTSIKCPMKQLRIQISTLGLLLADLRTDEDGNVDGAALLKVHDQCLIILADINLVTKRCGVWSDSDALDLRGICSFAESVQRVADQRVPLMEVPWTITWATQDTLPCAVDVDELSLKAWLSKYDLEAQHGNRDAFDTIIARTRQNQPQAINYAHAESALLRALIRAGAPGELFLGTSNDTCYACHEYLQAVNTAYRTAFRVRACSGIVYPTVFPEMDEGKVAQVLRERLLDTFEIHFEETARLKGIYGKPRDMIDYVLELDPELAESMQEAMKKSSK